MCVFVCGGKYVCVVWRVFMYVCETFFVCATIYVLCVWVCCVVCLMERVFLN